MRLRVTATFIGLIATLAFVAPALARAATINAASCSQTDVQNAINSANSGDTVNIPAGNCTWSSAMTLSKFVKLHGAGGGGFVGRSVTSQTIGTGSMTFTTTSGLNFQTGETITAMYLANGYADQMTGTVASYSGTTLTLNVTSVKGSGTDAAWLFARPGQTNITDSFSTADQNLIQIPENTSGSIEISGIHFMDAAGSNVIGISPTTNGQPVLVHDNWFAVSSGRSIETSSNKGIVYKNSFDNGMCAGNGCSI